MPRKCLCLCLWYFGGSKQIPHLFRSFWLSKRYLLSFMKLLNIPCSGWTRCIFPCWKCSCKGKIRLLPRSLCMVPCRAPSPCHSVPPCIDSWTGLQLDLALRESTMLSVISLLGWSRAGQTPPDSSQRASWMDLGPKWGQHLLILWIMQSGLSELSVFYRAAFCVKWLPGNLSFLLKIVF